jgi:D-arabinan endo alpha-(1,5)-arabinofuranosidase
MMKLIDFAARTVRPDQIKSAGYEGVVACVSESRRRAKSGSTPITRDYADGLRAAGLHIVSSFQYGRPGGYPRGFDGGVADARTALRLHEAAGGSDSAPIMFSIDEDIDLDSWNGVAVEWFRGINSVIGEDRTGIHGHSRVCAWAIRDGVVGCSTTPGRRWVWQTRAWSYGEREPAAVLYQDVIDTASNPGPLVGGTRVDENQVLATDFGQWGLDRSTHSPGGLGYPGSPIRQRARGRHVAAVQDRLNTADGAGLLVDGEFASLTSRAVVAFQRSRGLIADGEVGSATWAALFPDGGRSPQRSDLGGAQILVAPTRDVTGPGITTSVAMEAADLGILRWDPDRRAIAAMFGDNFEFVGMHGEWLSPSIVMYDNDYNVLGVPDTGNRIVMRRRRQLWPYHHNNGEYTTILPCDFIRIGDWWHVAVMVTNGLGNELRTEFHRSRDLVGWEVPRELNLPHPSHPGNTMLTFDRIGDYVYIFGTGGLARDRGIWMWRNPANQFPHGWWEPWGWDGFRWDWGIPNEGTPILQGRYGELSFRYLQGNCVLSYFDAGEYKQQARTVENPEDNWQDGANVVDYAFGFEIANLYGGYISPLSRLNEGGGMHFWVSQWVNNDNYRVMLVQDTLWAR